MNNLKNLIGQRFNNLTVVEEAENDKWNKKQWKCLCVCGKIIIVRTYHLINGRKKSCGCEKNIAGKRFGKFVALERVENNKRQLVCWKCRCDCGKEIIIEKHKLLNNKIKSCGCSRIKNLIGQKFGNLLVLERADNKNGKIHWKCVCRCGKTAIVSSSNLSRGNTQTCGCSRVSDYIGKKFGKLVILERVDGDKWKNAQWRCKCECGNEIITNTGSLKKNTQSCGCLIYRKRENSPNFKGCGEISKHFWNQIVYGANSRNLLLEIDIRYIWKLFLKQNRRCALTGRLLNFKSKSKVFDGTASLDRINSSKGYIVGNVQWVHKDINIIKQDLSEEKFIQYCREVVYYKNNKIENEILEDELYS